MIDETHLKLIIMYRIFILIFLFPSNSFSQTSNITGVITYFFNDNLGNKPDIGATVYVFDLTAVKQFNYITIDSFIKAKSYHSIYNLKLHVLSNNQEVLKMTKKKAKDYEANKAQVEKSKVELNKSLQELKELGIETEEKYNKLDSYTASVMLKAIYTLNPIKTIVDGNGNYNVKLNHGNYVVLINSSGRKGNNVTEARGQIFQQKVELSGNETKNISNNFELD